MWYHAVASSAATRQSIGSSGGARFCLALDSGVIPRSNWLAHTHTHRPALKNIHKYIHTHPRIRFVVIRASGRRLTEQRVVDFSNFNTQLKWEGKLVGRKPREVATDETGRRDGRITSSGNSVRCTKKFIKNKTSSVTVDLDTRLGIPHKTI
ncbi:hypothetical protein EVAR_11534_1 [Eumeta japonica]|uniref:Uncharacterized protein n=1 Tax=Eumeta variegata TaxID=151549 RepID=A0A4C1TYS3_EUMVA|nr:hypothetical protein EVAR_11534_1 [Eumeta japonica]